MSDSDAPTILASLDGTIVRTFATPHDQSYAPEVLMDGPLLDAAEPVEDPGDETVYVYKRDPLRNGWQLVKLADTITPKMLSAPDS